jgi:hypothetical protein
MENSMALTNTQGVSKRKVWAGWILRTMVTLAIAGSGIAKIAHVPKMVDGLVHAGIPQEAILPIAILELSCLALYLIPRTAILGTFLLTGYFGGAIVVHIIIGESIIPPLMIGLWAWGGAYFRVPELQELLPLRRGSDDVRASHASIAFPAHS